MTASPFLLSAALALLFGGAARGTTVCLTWLPAARETQPIRQLALPEEMGPETADACRMRLAYL